MLRCAVSFVIAAYARVRLIPQDLRALPAELFRSPSKIRSFFYFLRVTQEITGRLILPEDRRYRSWVEVDLDHFTSNWDEMKRLMGPHCRIMQVVKADAYGHGALEI